MRIDGTMSPTAHGGRSSTAWWSWLVLGLALLGPRSLWARPELRTVETDDGQPRTIEVETHCYKVRFDLTMRGATQSVNYKPLNHELRAENYYGNHMPLFHNVPRLADPDPVTGFTRRTTGLELNRKNNMCAATYKVVNHTDDEIAVEFEWHNSTQGEQPWMEKIISRHRLFFRDASPAVRVEYEMANTDAETRSVLVECFNSASVGRVETRNSILSTEGKQTDIDRAHESGSTFLLVPELAADWVGGVNEQGLGVGFSYHWPDLDAMQICNWKTVGASYHTILRRRDIPAGQSITFTYWFMPFTGFESFDGMKNDLAGGFRLGADAKPGATVPIKVFLASGSHRTVSVKLQCMRAEDKALVLDDTRSLDLKTGETANLASQATFHLPGLYVLTIRADDGKGTGLRMERGMEVGRTKLTWQPTLPAGEKLGRRDGAENLAPPRWHEQFRTLDRSLVTQHLPLLRGHAKGPVRAFFLTPVDPTLCHVRELTQRADFEYEYFAAERIANPRGTLNHQALAEFRQAFKKSDADVLVAFGINCETGLKQSLFRDVIARVEDGMGAVLITDAVDRQPILQKAIEEWTKVDGVPFPALATMSGLRQATRYTFGQGRIVVIPIPMRYMRDEGEQSLLGWTRLLVAGKEIEIPEIKWRGFEYSYAALADLVRWAARKESEITISAAAWHRDTLSVEIENAGPALNAALSVLPRTRRWEACPGSAAQVQIPAGKSSHAPQLASIPDAGPVAFEIHVRDADGKVLAFGSACAVIDRGVSLKVTCEPRSQPAERPGNCRVDVSGTVEKGRVDVSVIDRFGRTVLKAAQDAALVEGKASTEIDLSPIKPLCVFHEIVAEFTPAGAPRRSAQASELVFLLPKRPSFEDRFVAGAAGAPERKIKHIQGMLDACRRAAITLHTHSYYDPLVYATGGDMTAYNTLSPQRKLEKNIMNPPLFDDDETVAKTKEAWQKGTRVLYERGVRGVLIDDERRLSGEYDWNPKTLAVFREHLKKRYGDVARLNKSWGMTFESFDRAVPKTREEIGFPAANVAPWLEFRMFVGDLLARNYTQRPAEWAAEISPELFIGELGMYLPSPEWPVDWSQYAKYYRHTGHYRDPMLTEYFRSFAPDCNHGTWQGYGMTEIAPGRRIELWQSLLDGGHWVWFWEMRCPGSLNYAVCTSDLRVTNGYSALAAEEFPDIMGGLDRILIASTFTDDRIAVAYSYPSWLADLNAHGAASKGILEELGYQSIHMTLDDVAAGRMQKEGYRLLILQHTSCMSPEQMAGVQRFVESGGTALIVGRIGWRDLVGSPHDAGSLADALAGIDTAKITPLGKPMTSAEKEMPITVTVQSVGVLAKGADVLASASLPGGQSLPILTRRNLGKGKVLWLNSSLDGHSAYRTGGIAGEKSLTLTGPEAIRNSHFKIYETTLQESGISPRARLHQGDQPVFSGESWYYRSPSGRSLYYARYVRDGVEGKVAVRLSQKGHIYNLRTQQYVGQVDSFDDTFPAGRVQVYGILNYKVTGLAAKLSAATAKPGDVLTLSCDVGTEGGPADLHGIRVQMAGPDGAELEAHRTVLLARDGRAELTLPIALNQPAGRHTIRLMDCVSGAKTEVELPVAVAP